ncbi:HAD-IB family hydrolase [Corynebacterium yudongzhengii]|uniref:HAD family hydrolase n=1 Tax=Corynebacterium yudongzhengii TaxID=2080740 RepID=A0A2U1T5D2_9CORY|nr:HAD family hydrolase [Corynebacterium yudongzhengii]AWB81091.1 HAD-IB family hydrolase [Corynebacterium yudongzhengii]PWC01217.1 HAD family hydrolase [Corynebacterium yudongzhengii]
MSDSSRSSHHALPAPQTRQAAFFDLDKTIIATNSAFAFGKQFMHNGLISHSEALQISLAKASFMMSGLSSEQMDSTRDQMAELVTGWEVDEVVRIAREALHTVVTPTIYAEARELIRYHRAAGRDVIIISASASQLVSLIGEELGVHDIVATELEVVDGKFTGEILTYLKGGAKAEAMKKLAQERGYDMSASFAYSDSATDIPMLELVGNPVAVNPDRQMKKTALENGWEIRSFRDPVPLLQLPNAREISIGAGVLAGLAAVTAGGIWFAQRNRPNAS